MLTENTSCRFVMLLYPSSNHFLIEFALKYLYKLPSCRHFLLYFLSLHTLHKQQMHYSMSLIAIQSSKKSHFKALFKDFVVFLHSFNRVYAVSMHYAKFCINHYKFSINKIILIYANFSFIRSIHC